MTREIVPVAFTIPVSVLNAFQPETREVSDLTSTIYFYSMDIYHDAELPYFFNENQSGMQIDKAGSQDDDGSALMYAAAYVWAAGASSMILYGVIQYMQLRSKLIGAMVYRRNVYLSDYIDTPFVMGILRPKIYLPTHTPTKERIYIIAHEQHHICRCDHIIKLLAYLTLCIHWFNPLVWAAFILAGRDMEMSCDEAVIWKMGTQIRADYSASLLRLATHKKIIAGMLLAFGEGDTKGRVMNMAKWRKPKLWVSIVCAVVCIAVLAACAVNPIQKNTETEQRSLSILSEDAINILITGFADESGAGIADSTILLSVHPEQRTAIVGTVLRDTYVSLPDYREHITGNSKFSACYTLGKAWGGTEAAEEMVNQCVKDNFGITVDHNMELVGSAYSDFTDVLNDIVGNLETPLRPELQDVSESLLSLIAGTDDPEKITQVKELLATAKWDNCTIPFEGTYTAKSVELGGKLTNVLVIEESENGI